MAKKKTTRKKPVTKKKPLRDPLSQPGEQAPVSIVKPKKKPAPKPRARGNRPRADVFIPPANLDTPAPVVKKPKAPKPSAHGDQPRAVPKPFIPGRKIPVVQPLGPPVPLKKGQYWKLPAK